MRERLYVQQNVLGKQLLAPHAARPVEHAVHVRARFLESEARQAHVARLGQAAAVVPRQHVLDEILVAAQEEEPHDGAVLEPQAPQRLAFAQRLGVLAIHRVDGDERLPALAGLVDEKYLENATQLSDARLDRARPDRAHEVIEHAGAVERRLHAHGVHAAQARQGLIDERRLADPRRAAQEQALKAAACGCQLGDALARVTDRLRGEVRPYRLGRERVRLKPKLLDEHRTYLPPS